MTVTRMRQEMPADEYMHWGVYFGRLAQRAELARLRADARGGQPL